MFKAIYNSKIQRQTIIILDCKNWSCIKYWFNCLKHGFLTKLRNVLDCTKSQSYNNVAMKSKKKVLSMAQYILLLATHSNYYIYQLWSEWQKLAQETLHTMTTIKEFLWFIYTMVHFYAVNSVSWEIFCHSELWATALHVLHKGHSIFSAA